MKRTISILLTLALLLLTACAAAEQAPASEPESGPSSASASSEPSSVPEKPSSAPEEPSQPEEVPDPDLDGWEPNPDMAPFESDLPPEEEEMRERAAQLYAETYEDFGAPRDSYSYYYPYYDEDERLVILRVGVIDEAAVDSFLAAWTGPKWDKLVKEPGHASLARQEEFAEKAEQLELDPRIEVWTRVISECFNGENEKIYVSVRFPNLDGTPEEVEHWQEKPQVLKDLEKEMGIPEGMVWYFPPRYTPPGVNPDT